MSRSLSFWGLCCFIWSALATPLDRVIAIVNEDVITQSELKTETALARQQLAARHMPIPTSRVLEKQVLNHLIDEQVQLQLAKTHQLSIDNIELDETISRIAASNHVSVEEMRQEIERRGMSFERYRESIRKEMLMNRIQQSAVGKEIVVSRKQIRDYLNSYEHVSTTPKRFHVQNIVVPLPEAPTSAQLIRAKQKAYALMEKIKKGADFTTIALKESSSSDALQGGDLGERHLAELPELFAKKIVDMKVGDIAGPLRAGNGFQVIKLVSVADADMHHEVLKTHVRHILLKQGMNMTEAEADRQIHNIYEQLKSGKDFAIMAKKYSQDPVSAAQGGDLGWMTADALVPSFAEAMNVLPIGKISQPVKTPFGWHLIQVLARKTEDDSDAYQRQQVKQFLYQRKFNEAVVNWQQHMRSAAYVHILDKDLA